MSYAYVLYSDGSSFYTLFDSTDGFKDNGEVFDIDYQELSGVLGGEAYVQDYITTDEYGTFLTAYLPIRNAQGDVIAVLGCDYDASGISSKIKEVFIRTIILIIICVVVGSILVGLIAKGIVRRLKGLSTRIFELVHMEGDLTQTIEMTTGDELEIMAGNINELIRYFQKIMLLIRSNSADLNSSTNEVAKRIFDAQGNITDVSATMEEMSAAMEQTSASLTQVNDSVEDIFESIEGISQRAAEGSEFANGILEKARSKGDEAKASLSVAHEKVSDLEKAVQEKIEQSKSVEQISVLTANIIEITQQTNLLALNAAIEAARAGEAGKGFSVVADQISSLSTNSAEAAEEIKKVSSEVIDVVNQLAKVSEEMISFMDETAMEGYNQMVVMAEEFRDAVNRTNDMMDEFAKSSLDLKSNMDAVKQSINDVNIAVEESANGVTNVSGMSVELSENVSDIGNEADTNMNIAKELDGQVNKFRLD